MQIAITALGNNHPDLIREISNAIAACHCNVVETRMTTLANEMAILMLINGNWNHIAKLETTLDGLSKKFSVAIIRHRTDPPRASAEHIPYSIDACGVDRPGILQDLTDFLSEREILIQDISGGCQPAAYSQATLFSVHITVAVPTELALISLRDEFLEFCDRLNLDAMLDPIKR